MTAETFREIERGGAWVDLSGRAKWRASGSDRVRYLNGQVTQDVRKASPRDTVYACLTSAKGKIEGDLFIHAAPDDALLLDAEPGLRDSLGGRLEKYVVADDVEFSDVTEGWSLHHVFGPAAEPWDPERGTRSTPGCRAVRSTRFGMPGVDVWSEAGGPAPGFEARELGEADAEVLRICRGIPRWPVELNGETFPQEAGLEERAMDFFKGCYLGQEILSRVKTTGRMPRKLVRFVARTGVGDGPFPGTGGVAWRLFAGPPEAPREAGLVTSACLHPELDRVAGLGYVRQGLEQEPSLLLAPEDPPGILSEVEIVRQ